MKFRYVLLLIFISIISCKGKDSENVDTNIDSTNTETTTKNKSESNINITEIIENLQGEWKEKDYPFRSVIFEGYKIKFIEEGVSEDLVFKKYKITNECIYKTNNIKNISPQDLILIIPEDERCEKINISKDTLIFSGFNVSSGSDYKIVYIKQE